MPFIRTAIGLRAISASEGFVRLYEKHGVGFQDWQEYTSQNWSGIGTATWALQGRIFASVAAADTPPQFWGDTTLWAEINGPADRVPLRLNGSVLCHIDEERAYV